MNASSGYGKQVVLLPEKVLAFLNWLLFGNDNMKKEHPKVDPACWATILDLEIAINNQAAFIDLLVCKILFIIGEDDPDNIVPGLVTIESNERARLQAAFNAVCEAIKKPC